MGFSMSSTSVLCSTREDQHSKCGMITWYSQLLHISLNIRYVSLFRFEAYPFTPLNLRFGCSHKFYLTIFWFVPVMAPIVKVEPNGSQTLLSHDGVIEKLSQVGWLDFVQSFRGLNLDVAKEFTKFFDGVRVKVGDVQFQIEEDFVAKAAGLPLSGDKWFKNARIENIPWWSLLISKQMKYHVKGMPLD